MDTKKLWKEQYDSIIVTDISLGNVATDGNNDRREYPRWEPSNKKIGLYLGKTSVPIVNISAGGICFISENEYFRDDVVFFATEHMNFDAIVLDCEMHLMDKVFMEYRYKARAKYAPAVNGFRVYVLVHSLSDML